MMFAAWLLAQAAVAASPSPPPTSLQAQFEQASAALQAEKWADAAAGFEAIAARPSASGRTRGIAKLRMGLALLRMNQDAKAKRLLGEGLELVGGADATIDEDRVDARLALGGLEKGDYDYVAARREFEQALALAKDSTAKIRALLALVSVTMFDDGDAALRYADAMVQVASTVKVSPQVDATIRDLRGRVLLNRGDYKGAIADLEIALKDMGGLTSHTDLNDVTVRADLALANFLGGNPSRAREIFEMTGEGRLPAGPFATAARTDLPACGGDLRPEDKAVVEFGIGKDGAVSYSNPVYASRLGPMARELAQAVSGWSWKASDASAIPDFYRLATRVELRCSNAVQRPADLDLLLPKVAAWLGGAGGFDVERTLNAAEATRLRADLHALEGPTKDRRPLIAALTMLAAAPTTDHAESRDRYARAAALATEADAPAAVFAYLALSSDAAAITGGSGSWKRYLAQIRDVLAVPRIQADAETASVLRLILGSPRQGEGYAPDAETALRAVIDDKRLANRDALKVGALVRLSSLQAQRGQIDAARASFAQSGLNAQQCSLVDAQPAMQKMGMGSNDYPTEMLRMGVSGWTQVELDVLPNGQTTNRRAVISYPPLMFGDGTVKAMAKTRYTQSYRPDGGLGCGGATMRVRYLMPQS